jgi:hypothetical protein
MYQFCQVTQDKFNYIHTTKQAQHSVFKSYHTITFVNIIQFKWVRKCLFQWWIHKLGILLLQSLDNLSTKKEKKLQIKILKPTFTRNKIVKWICHCSKTIYPFEPEKVELLLYQIWLVVSQKISYFSILIVIVHI